MYVKDAAKLFGKPICDDQKIADIMNEKYDNAINEIQNMRTQMIPHVKQLYDTAMEMARFKQERMSPLIGKFFRVNRSTVFMVCCHPIIKFGNKEKAIGRFLQEYATGAKKFDANEWIGFNWKAIPIIEVSVGDQDEGCGYCGIGYTDGSEEDEVYTCNHCGNGRFHIYYSTVESTACIADDPVKRFKQKYHEIPKEDFINTLYCGIYKLTHACNVQLDKVGEYLKDRIGDIRISFDYYDGFEVKPPSCNSETFRIIDLFNEACRFPDTKYYNHKYPQFFKPITSKEEMYDNEISRIQNEKHELDGTLEQYKDQYEYDQSHTDDDDDFDLGM